MTRGLYAYDAFGKPLISASHVDNDFQYTGEQADTETGLIYLRSRYYDPEIGRFISRDPFTGFDTNPQSLNRYTYVHNNPVRYADPSGRVAWYAAPAVVGAAVNEAYYVGQVTGTYLSTGQWTGSWCIAGGRAAGGAAGGEVGAYIMATTMNPWVAGAAASGTSYAVDRGTQVVLSGLGVPGPTEDFTMEGAGIALGAGVVTGPVSNMAIPYSPTNTVTEIYARNVISNAGGSITGSYMNYAINSNQGPVRLGGGSYSGGKLY
jgi:RHS repeat-associated protein